MTHLHWKMVAIGNANLLHHFRSRLQQLVPQRHPSCFRLLSIMTQFHSLKVRENLELVSIVSVGREKNFSDFGCHQRRGKYWGKRKEKWVEGAQAEHNHLHLLCARQMLFSIGPRIHIIHPMKYLFLYFSPFSNSRWKFNKQRLDFCLNKKPEGSSEITSTENSPETRKTLLSHWLHSLVGVFKLSFLSSGI